MVQQRNALQTPEERELERKRAKLTDLEAELADAELALATLRAEVRAFERRYIRVVGVLFAELDDLNAQLAEARFRRRPQDSNLYQNARDARTRATESASAVGELPQENTVSEFAPREDVKTLYREVAKLVHPDLSTDERERVRRTQLMAEANRAYAAGDDAALRRIIDDWVSSPESVQGEGVAAELVRTIRKIHQVKRRLLDIEAETSELKTSEVCVLCERVAQAKAQGRDLLAEMAEELRIQIGAVRTQLNAAIDGAFV